MYINIFNDYYISNLGEFNYERIFKHIAEQ